MNKCDILSLMSKSERITVAGYFNVSNTRKTLDIHFFPLMLIQFSFKHVAEEFFLLNENSFLWERVCWAHFYDFSVRQKPQKHPDVKISQQV